VQNLVFQEIYKFSTQHFLNYPIHYWRTKSGAEVDFVMYKNESSILPIEVKYRNMSNVSISRSFRSFLQAYQPKNGVVITKDFSAQAKIENVDVHFIPLEYLSQIYALIRSL